MNKATEEKAKKALAAREKQLKRQNEYIKNNYFRTSVAMPKEYERIIKENEKTVSSYIMRLINEDLTRRGLLER